MTSLEPSDSTNLSSFSYFFSLSMKTVMRMTKTAKLTGGISFLYHAACTSYKTGSGKTCKLIRQLLTCKNHLRSARHNEGQGGPEEARTLPWYKTANPWA